MIIDNDNAVEISSFGFLITTRLILRHYFTSTVLEIRFDLNFSNNLSIMICIILTIRFGTLTREKKKSKNVIFITVSPILVHRISRIKSLTRLYTSS